MHYTLLLALLTLTGCSTVTSTEDSKYGTSNQGIPLSSLEIHKLKVGMHKRQVANLIGHPPHINPFSPDTWIYFNMKHGKIQNSETLKLTFANNKLTKIESSNKKSNKSG